MLIAVVPEDAEERMGGRDKLLIVDIEELREPEELDIEGSPLREVEE